MAKLTVNPPKQPPMFRLEPFRGIDLSTNESQIDKNHSPDMLNMNTDERGSLQKRTGYKRLYSTSLGTGKINGLFQYTKPDGTTVFLIAWGTGLYEQTGTAQPTSIYSGKADADTSFFVMGGNCYIMDGTNFLVYDGTTVSDVTANPYIPTLTVGRPPAGGGTAYEDWNLIGSGFKDSFSADGTATNYQLSLTNLDATAVTATVNGTALTETTDFTVNRTTGVVTFNTAPATGTDNVIITAYKTYITKPSQITKCTMNVEFGGNNDSHIFVSGNPDNINWAWRSGVYDPTYWPENGFYKVGSDAEKIQGFSHQYTYLVIHKEHSLWNMAFQLNNGDPTYPISPINGKTGAIAPKSINLIENTPISLDEKGVFVLKASTVREQNNVEHISQAVDRQLLTESNLEKAVSINFDSKYWLAVNGNVYVFDYLIKEWFIYDNIHVNCFMAADNYLYFGSDSDGLIFQFKKDTDPTPYNDDGIAINAYWYSKLIAFEHPEMLKIVRHIYSTIKPLSHTSVNVYLRTDKKGEVLIGTQRADQFNFLNFDFTKFTFVVSDIPQEFSKKKREKKITDIQIKLENNTLDEGLGVTSLGLMYDFQRQVK